MERNPAPHRQETKLNPTGHGWTPVLSDSKNFPIFFFFNKCEFFGLISDKLFVYWQNCLSDFFEFLAEIVCLTLTLSQLRLHVFLVLKAFGKFWRRLLANHLVKKYIMILYSAFYQESFNFYAIFFIKLLIWSLSMYILIYLLSINSDSELTSCLSCFEDLW